MSITEIDGRLLVEAHQQGDERAFAEIARVAYPSLYHHARRRLRDHQAAEDAVQETFVRAFRALPRFEGDFRLQAWLHRILANVCADEGSRRTRELHLAERVGALSEPAAPDPADVTISEAERRDVVGALDGLPAAYRTAVSLRYLSDLSYRDIATATGITEENARARVSRGRAALARLMARPVAAFALVAPTMRRLRRGASIPDASSTLAVDVTAASPLANVSAQLASHAVQVAPAVTRLAEVSASLGGARSSMAINVAGAVAAAMVPTAYVVFEPGPAAPPAVVVAADPGPLDTTTSTAEAPTTSVILATTLPTGVTTTLVSLVPQVSPRTKAGQNPDASSSAPAPSSPTPPVSTAPDEATPGAGRTGGLASDRLSTFEDGPHLHLSGPVGWATADKRTGAGSGTEGVLRGELDFGDMTDDGSRSLAAVMTVTIDGREHSLRLEGRVVTERDADGSTVHRFSGRYRLGDAAEVGMDPQGAATFSLAGTVRGASSSDDSPTWSLRMYLGDAPTAQPTG